MSTFDPRVLRTISYAWSDEQYQTISILAKIENRKMRNMLFHIVEKYIAELPEEVRSRIQVGVRPQTLTHGTSTSTTELLKK